jgi:hypothetical protein
MSLKDELLEMINKDRDEMQEVQKELDNLNNRSFELKKSIESTEYLLRYKFGVQENKNDMKEQEKTIEKSDKKLRSENSITSLAFNILNEKRNQPLHINEIHELLEKMGKKVGKFSIPNSLNRDKRFENIGNNTYKIEENTYQKESASSGR